MADGYRPISDYGVIGNLRTAAMVGKDGSIDWCCFPHFDSPSVFGALLDQGVGGRFRVGVTGAAGDQSYLDDTNVLLTRFRPSEGELTVLDLMPVWGDITTLGQSYAPSEILRMMVCRKGPIDVEVEWSPRFDYGRKVPRIDGTDGGWVARHGELKMSLGGMPEALVERGDLRATFRMREGEKRSVICRWASDDVSVDVKTAQEAVDRTAEVWREWAHGGEPVHRPEWARDHYSSIIRSELVLKLMTNGDTGAILAAPTTSLPESIGGGRNWDYRYAWIRDAALASQALISLGHEKEAVDFLYWIENVSAGHFHDGRGPQIMYGAYGEEDLREEELGHLEGYMGSRPVRVGNEAAKQIQLEVYGEIMNTAYELARRGIRLGERINDFLVKVAEYVTLIWNDKDHGIWEIRGEKRHYTYSKIMLWVALDRAVHLTERYGLAGYAGRWADERANIRGSILRDGYDEELGAFVQSYGSKVLDAANLRIPLMEFLPVDDHRVQGTIDRSLRELSVNGMVYRYQGVDPSEWGDEGVFGICTFWLVDVLALSGRLREAREIFETMLGHANHLGLLAEQVDPRDGRFLGNFPQTFTHLGLINSALYLAYAEGRRMPEHHLMGTRESRAVMARTRRGGFFTDGSTP